MSEDLVVASTTDTEAQIQEALDYGVDVKADPAKVLSTTVSDVKVEEPKKAEEEDTLVSTDKPDKPEEKPEKAAAKKPDDDDIGDVGKKVKKRIDKLTFQREEAARENAALKARIADLERQSQAKPPVVEKVAEPAAPEPEPKEDDFDTTADWMKAIAKWEAKQTVRESDEQRRQQSEQERAAAEREAQIKHFNDTREAAKARYDDFDSVMNAANDLRISGPTQFVIMTSPVGHDIAYYLATHPEEAVELFQMGEGPDTLRELGRIEERVKATAPKAATATARSTAADDAKENEEIDAEPAPKKVTPKPVTKTPDPLTPVGARATMSTMSDEEMDFQAYKAKRAREEMERRRNRR